RCCLRRDYALEITRLKRAGGPPSNRSWRLVLELADHDAGVVPAEAERVRDADRDVGLPRLVRDVVEVALGILLLVVDRRGQDPPIYREDRENRLHGAGGAEAVPGRAFRRGDADLGSVLLAQSLLDDQRLAGVAERRR